MSDMCGFFNVWDLRSPMPCGFARRPWSIRAGLSGGFGLTFVVMMRTRERVTCSCCIIFGRRCRACKALDVAADIRVGVEDHVSCRVAIHGREWTATVYAKVCSRPGVLEVKKRKRLGRLVKGSVVGVVGVWRCVAT